MPPHRDDSVAEQQGKASRRPTSHVRHASLGSTQGAFYGTADLNELAPPPNIPRQPPHTRTSPPRGHHHSRRGRNKLAHSAKHPADDDWMNKFSESATLEAPEASRNVVTAGVPELGYGTTSSDLDYSRPHEALQEYTSGGGRLHMDTSGRHGRTFRHIQSPHSLRYSDEPAGVDLLTQPTPRRHAQYGGGNYATRRVPPPPPPPVAYQQQDIASFAAMAVGSLSAEEKKRYEREFLEQFHGYRSDDDDNKDESSGDSSSLWSGESSDIGWHILTDGGLLYATIVDAVYDFFDPTAWLLIDSKMDEDGNHYFDEEWNYTLAAIVRHVLYNPLSPEFTSLQQFCWAVIIGILMGIYTAAWKNLIDAGVELVWKTVPEHLLEAGVFTDLEGSFPLYHYMWICPSIFGCILAYIFAAVPFKIPDQNEWINSLHSKGVIDSSTFLPLFVLSTLGMLSGLSLGPELPLVLTGGMVGSWFGLLTKQSVLQARVLNLTAASAAVSGFFGFPMAGALFVLELPHRMGLQYFEALSPATIASIAAVLTNRIIEKNDVTGYYRYPFLTPTLPSHIFTSAIVYGLFGAAVGAIYATYVVKLKALVHDLFHAPRDHSGDDHGAVGPIGVDDKESTLAIPSGEAAPLVAETKHASKRPPIITLPERIKAFGCIFIKDEPLRAATASALAGVVVGVIGMYLPHTMFWGEAQLQNIIDKGRTPLPIFGEDDEPTAALVALGRCMIDSSDENAVRDGFSLGCSFLITVLKIVVVGLSLGTGIIAGQFWGPLFVGCAASHFFTDSVNALADSYGFGRSLAAYPCVVILCTMGSAHVVTFRSHMAIMLILTLTISAFDPENNTNSPFSVSGDYSAVFPLLVVSVFVSLMTSRSLVFYKTQRSRGDITAIPEVLCQPGMVGRPLVVDYDNDNNTNESSSRDSPFGDHGRAVSLEGPMLTAGNKQVRNVQEDITQNDIEFAFEQQKSAQTPIDKALTTSTDSKDDLFEKPLTALPLTSSRLDGLLSKPIETTDADRSTGHRHTRSALPRLQAAARKLASRVTSMHHRSPQSGARERADSNGSGSGSLVRVDSFGEISAEQPSLMDQARMRSASSAVESRHQRVASAGESSRHRRLPSLPSGRHSRKGSDTSFDFNLSGALSIDDIAQSFNEVANQQTTKATTRFGSSPWTSNNSSDSKTLSR